MESCCRGKTARISRLKYPSPPLPAHLAVLPRPRTQSPLGLPPVPSPPQAMSPTRRRNQYCPREGARNENLRESFELLAHRVEPLAYSRRQSPSRPARSPVFRPQFPWQECDFSYRRRARPRRPPAAAPTGAFSPRLAPSFLARQSIRPLPCPDTCRECCRDMACPSTLQRMRQQSPRMEGRSLPTPRRWARIAQAALPAPRNSNSS